MQPYLFDGIINIIADEMIRAVSPPLSHCTHEQLVAEVAHRVNVISNQRETFQLAANKLSEELEVLRS